MAGYLSVESRCVFNVIDRTAHKYVLTSSYERATAGEKHGGTVIVEPQVLRGVTAASAVVRATLCRVLLR